MDTCSLDWVSCTYTNAAKSLIDVASDKSIIGVVGDAGIMKEKGLCLTP